jgi:hypothetical protein
LPESSRSSWSSYRWRSSEPCSSGRPGKTESKTRPCKHVLASAAKRGWGASPLSSQSRLPLHSDRRAGRRRSYPRPRGRPERVDAVPVPLPPGRTSAAARFRRLRGVPVRNVRSSTASFDDQGDSGEQLGRHSSGACAARDSAGKDPNPARLEVRYCRRDGTPIRRRSGG